MLEILANDSDNQWSLSHDACRAERGEPSAIGADLVAAAAGARALSSVPRSARWRGRSVARCSHGSPARRRRARARRRRAADRCGAGGARVPRRRDGRVGARRVPAPSRRGTGAGAGRGAVIGGYDARRWRSGEQPRGVERFVSAWSRPGRAGRRRRARHALDNVARELVDAPPTSSPPPGLRSGQRPFRGSRSRPSTLPRPGSGHSPRSAGAARPSRCSSCSGTSRPAPRAHHGWGSSGKAVTFDTGGYFLKPQSDIVRQKADMAGGAAVVAALGAIAELGLPLSVTGSCRPARTCSAAARSGRPT